jgi:hypothetical protein
MPLLRVRAQLFAPSLTSSMAGEGACVSATRHARPFFFGDRFELPTGTRVALAELVSFKLQPSPSGPLRCPPKAPSSAV